MHYFTLICALNFLVFSVVLLAKTSPLKKSNAFLGIIFLLMVFYDLISAFLHYAYIYHDLTFLRFYIPFDYILCFSFGPLIYVYLCKIIDRKIKVYSIRNLINILSIIPSTIYIIWFLILPTNQRINHLRLNMIDLPIILAAINFLFYIQLTSYLIYCFIVINNKIKESKTVIIENTTISITWLKTYFIINIFIMILSLPVCIYFNNDYLNTIIAQIAINVQFVYIFINTTWQTGVFNENSLQQIHINNPIEIEQEVKINEPQIVLNEETANQFIKIIIDFLNNEKIYLQSGCSINDISKTTNIPVHHISYCINTKLNKNFFDLINEYRIEEAKSFFNDPKYSKSTIESIGYICGFGSKTSFNKAFKKFTNFTPSEYRQNKKM